VIDAERNCIVLGGSQDAFPYSASLEDVEAFFNEGAAAKSRRSK
jgi:hypothetical protein